MELRMLRKRESIDIEVLDFSNICLPFCICITDISKFELFSIFQF